MKMNRNLLITIGAVVGAALVTTLVYRMVSQRSTRRRDYPRRRQYTLEEMPASNVSESKQQMAEEVAIMEDARNRHFDDFPKFG